jgi:hypothetical protein
MKIDRRKDGRGRVAQVRQELGEILHGGMDGVPVCAPDCPKAGPGRCSRHCPDLPRMLSSDPENHPLESRIAPLVYELKRLEVFDPCWSCEGHNGTDGALWKIPRVWFYCRSVVHLRVLADALKELHLDRRLSVQWRVVLTFSDGDNADTTFSLEPSPVGPRPPLAALQRDVDTIAQHLRDVVFDEALKLSRNAGSGAGSGAGG